MGLFTQFGAGAVAADVSPAPTRYYGNLPSAIVAPAIVPAFEKFRCVITNQPF
jgi:hypothetical protein